MNNILVLSAGVLGSLVAVIHGLLGEFRVVRPVSAPSDSAKRVLHAIMFLSAVYWFVMGAGLIIAAIWMPSNTRDLLAVLGIFVFGTGSLGNLWATRGRHIGWVLLLVVTVLCAVSLLR